MTTTFKVVEFYRNNTSTNSSTNLVLNNSSTLNSSSAGVSTTTNGNESVGSNDTNMHSMMYNSLGFNIIGGYLTDLPATVTDISTSLNGRLVKVEEGDIIFEINGINTRHMTLSEIYKQLRCSGNRVCLKLKSDPDYKSRYKQILNSDSAATKSLLLKTGGTITGDKNPATNTTTTTTTTTTNNTNYCLFRNASKSYDNNINSYATNGTINSSDDANCLMNDDLSSSVFNTNHISASNSNNNILQQSETSNKITASSSLVTLSQQQQTPQLDQLLRQQIQPDSLDTNNRSNCSNSSPMLLNDETSTSSSISTSTNNHTSDSLSLTSSTSSFNNKLEHVYDNNKIINTNVNNNNNNNINNQLPKMIDSFDNQNEIQNQSFEIINSSVQPILPAPVLTFQIEIDDTIKKKIDEKLKECSSGDSDSDSEFNVYTPKAVDLPSAQRLAKRLYYLDGFKANDVVRHLSKKNDFSQLVADEYLKLFNFQSLTLDAALRKFLKQFQLVGDAQEKERVLMYFAKRYVDANNTAFTDVDSCHTLTCAIMLLNTDLHDSKIQNKMSLAEFIENLKGLNNGSNFPEVLLESLYSAIKNEPLECACLDNEDTVYEHERNGVISGTNTSNGNFSLRPLGSNPFLQIPDPQTAKEYKFGWLLRKCCIDSDGKKAPFLKRSWKMFYASLRDMVLYLHKDDKVFKNNTFDNITNAIRIHHAYAAVASDYKKKQFVFRLKTADWSEYLFQTSNSNELFEWVSTINLVAAMFSSPPLPGGIGSSKSFQRPLLPVSKTRYTLQEQFEYHKKHIKQLQSDLAKLESAAGASHNNHFSNHTNHYKEEKSFDKDKYNYLQFEVQRYTIYANMLEEKIISDQTATSATTTQLNMINPSFIFNDTATTNASYIHQQQLGYNHFQYNGVGVAGGSITSSTTQPYNNHHQYINTSQTNISLLNNTFNDTLTKSVPTTPTHFNTSLNTANNTPILKSLQQHQQQQQQNSQNLHVNFNISPNGNKTSNNFLINNNNTTIDCSNISPTITPTTTSTNTSTTTPTTIISASNKKFNNYFD